MRSAVATASALLLVAAFLAPSVLAQDNVITRRKAVMKQMGEHADAGGDILKGKASFDAAKAAVIFQSFKNGISGFTDLFPEGSDTGETKATAAVWSDRKGFEAAAAAFAKAVADNAAKGTTADGFKTAFTAVAGECRTCHQTYKSR